MTLIGTSVLSLNSLAQTNRDTTISTQRVNIYQEYTPEVVLPKKPILKPSDIYTETPQPSKLEYKVPQQSIRYSYGSVGIKPLALQPLEGKTNYQNYAAFGLGNLTTIFGDVGLTYHIPGTHDAYIHGYHFSQKGGSIPDRSSAFTEISGGGKYFWNTYAINVDASVTRRAQTAYGYDHDVFTLDKKDIRHNYFNINFDVGIDNIALTENKISFQPHVNANFLNGFNDASEMILKIDAPLSYTINENMNVGLSIKTEMDFYNHSWINLNESRKTNSYFMIVPKFIYTKDKLYVHAALQPTFSTGNNMKFLPDIQARMTFGAPSAISINAGIKGDVEMYSFKNLSEKNPFVYNPQNSNAIHNQFFAGVEYSMMSNLKLELNAIYHTFSNYATFRNDYVNDSTGRYFLIHYIPNTKVFELNAGAHVLIANKFDLGAKVGFYNYNEKVGFAYNEPTMHLKSYMKVRPIPELMVSAQLDVMAGINYLDEFGMRKSQKNIFNLGGSAQYDINERFVAFLNVDNIFNVKYQRWNQYNVYGFNIFAGAKFKF